jgi:hypothetical protein|tara:strand:- start:123 stop:329 length:207 start_codon:yes stop_codon:yes gene_type:complete
MFSELSAEKVKDVVRKKRSRAQERGHILTPEKIWDIVETLGSTQQVYQELLREFGMPVRRPIWREGKK